MGLKRRLGKRAMVECWGHWRLSATNLGSVGNALGLECRVIGGRLWNGAGSCEVPIYLNTQKE